MRLANYLIIICPLLTVLAGCAGAPKHSTWNNVTGTEQYEHLMWQAVRDQDWTNFEHHLAPTFVGVNASGQAFDRAGWVEHWKAQHLDEFSVGEVSVQPEGPDMVVTYVLHLNGKAGALAKPGASLRVISVWQQVKKGWMLAATSSTPVQAN